MAGHGKKSSATATANPSSPSKASPSKRAKPVKSYSKSPIAPKLKTGNIIDVFLTKVEEVIVQVYTKHDKPEAAYTNPMKKAFEEKTDELSDLWKIHGWFPRKNAAAAAKNVAMSVRAGSDYDWEVSVSLTFLLSEGDTPKSVGKNIAKHFSDFAKECKEVSALTYSCKSLQLLKRYH